MNKVALLLVILINSLFWMDNKSNNNIVAEFGIATTDTPWATSGSTIALTLLYDSIIYQCNVVPNELSTEFSCLGSSSFVDSGCTGINTQEMFIEHTIYATDIDAVEIDYIFITDLNKNKVTVSTNNLCLDLTECDSNTALVNIDTLSVDVSVLTYSYNCSLVIVNF